MGKVVREGVAKASASTIWKSCFQSMKWEIWDPDAKCLENIQLKVLEEDEAAKHDGPSGMYNHHNFMFHMKNGQKLPTTLTGVESYKSFVFSGKAFLGMMGFAGQIDLTPDPNNDLETHVKYTFELNGLIGGLFGKLQAKLVEEGTEHGLANIIRLSEEAEQASSK